MLNNNNTGSITYMYFQAYNYYSKQKLIQRKQKFMDTWLL